MQERVINIFSEKNINDLQLSAEQRTIYNDLANKEQVTRKILLDAGINAKVIDKIISKTDLQKIDTDNDALLREQIVETWGDFIIKR